jgi:hypothetical protein
MGGIAPPLTYKFQSIGLSSGPPFIRGVALFCAAFTHLQASQDFEACLSYFYLLEPAIVGLCVEAHASHSVVGVSFGCVV